ncbi:MAG: RDD family protein [Actinoallomurus sp.]
MAYATASLVIVTLLAANWFIEVWMPHRWFGGTPGMRWLDLRVVTERGESPGLRTYMIRWLMAVVDGYFFGLVGALAHRVQPSSPALRRHGRPHRRRTPPTDQVALPGPDGDLGAVAKRRACAGRRSGASWP